jgi:hypothetical protein
MITSVTSSDSDINAIQIVHNQYSGLLPNDQSNEESRSNVYDADDESDVCDEPLLISDDDEILDYIYCISCVIQ